MCLYLNVPTILTCWIFLSDVFDPLQIGDKAKWFAQPLDTVNHSTLEGGSTLVAAVTMADEILSQHNSDAPTDESGESWFVIQKFWFSLVMDRYQYPIL